MHHIPTDHAILMVLTGPSHAQAAKRWLLEQRSMIAGRHASCDIHLPDRQISRKHARIYHTSEGFFIEDLGSKNGTYVNGEPIEQPQRLSDGDVLQIGLAYRLSFVGAEGTVPLTYDAEQAFTLRLDETKKQVWIGGKVLNPPLSPAQFDLLELLANAQGSIVDRDTIALTVWGSTEGVTEQAIDALIRRLRRRLAEINSNKEFVATVRGYGFRLDTSPSKESSKK